MKKEKHIELEAKDGLKLHAVVSAPQNPIAVVSHIHGFGEHAGRYVEMRAWFLDRQIAVVSMDLRGHGKSAGPRGHALGLEEILGDIDQLVDYTKTAFRAVPHFFYGHSLGGNLSLRYIINRKPRLQGLICSSAMLIPRQKPPALLVPISKLLSRITPQFSQTLKPDHKGISSIPAEQERYLEDKLNHSKVSVRMATTILKSMDFLNAFEGSFPIPLLLLTGSSDPIINPEGSRLLAERISSSVTYRSFEGNFHEIHWDVSKLDFFEAIAGWIFDQLER